MELSSSVDLSLSDPKSTMCKDPNHTLFKFEVTKLRDDQRYIR